MWREALLYPIGSLFFFSSGNYLFRHLEDESKFGGFFYPSLGMLCSAILIGVLSLVIRSIKHKRCMAPFEGNFKNHPGSKYLVLSSMIGSIPVLTLNGLSLDVDASVFRLILSLFPISSCGLLALSSYPFHSYLRILGVLAVLLGTELPFLEWSTQLSVIGIVASLAVLFCYVVKIVLLKKASLQANLSGFIVCAMEGTIGSVIAVCYYSYSSYLDELDHYVYLAIGFSYGLSSYLLILSLLEGNGIINTSISTLKVLVILACFAGVEFYWNLGLFVGLAGMLLLIAIQCRDDNSYQRLD